MSEQKLYYKEDDNVLNAIKARNMFSESVKEKVHKNLLPLIEKSVKKCQNMITVNVSNDTEHREFIRQVEDLGFKIIRMRGISMQEGIEYVIGI